MEEGRAWRGSVGEDPTSMTWSALAALPLIVALEVVYARTAEANGEGISWGGEGKCPGVVGKMREVSYLKSRGKILLIQLGSELMKLNLSALSARTKWLVAALLLVLIVTGGALVSAHLYYRTHVIPGITVMGENVSGLDRQALADRVKARVEGATVSLEVEGTTRTASAQDLGITIDTDKAVNEVFATTSTVNGQLKAAFTGIDVRPEATIDDAALEDFAKHLIEDASGRVENATVTFQAENEQFVVSPAREGKTVNVEQVKEAAQSLVSSFAPVTARIEVAHQQPAVSTPMAEESAAAANRLIATEISLTDGITVFHPSVADKAAWVSLTVDASGLKGPVADEAKVTEWVTKTAEATNEEPVKGIKNVNSRGEEVSIHSAGKSGWKVTNASAVAKDVVSAFRAGQAYAGSFDYDEAKPEFDKRLIADGAGALVYHAVPGEKWIDIDLSSNTVSAYEGATIVQGPVYMVPGAPDTPTITGTFKVWHQNPLQTMRGLNSDGTRYETPNVPWATYFHGDFALHGAPWRSSFGWSGPGGSHGCVNMPVESARWIYEWADIGTTVVSHY